MSDFQGAARLVSEALVLAALAAPVLSPALLCSASRFPAAGGCAGASLQLPVVVTQRVRGGPLGSCVSPFVACFYLLLPSFEIRGAAFWCVSTSISIGGTSFVRCMFSKHMHLVQVLKIFDEI